MLEEFKKIKFVDKNHTYWKEGTQLPSFSSLLSKLYEPFDSNTIVPKYAKKNNFTETQVKSAWNTQNTKETLEGSRVHDFAEMYVTQKYLKNMSPDKCVLPQSSQDLGVIAWWNNVGSKYKICSLEQVMGNDIFCGTADILLWLDEEFKQVIIADYKSNKDIFKDSFGKRLYYPFEFLEDTPYNKYQIQLSAYQVLLEDAGYTVMDRILIWLNKTGSTLYQEFHTEDYSKEFRTFLKTL